MASYDYDLFVIGAGSGGTRASRIAAGYGARVAVAEQHQRRPPAAAEDRADRPAEPTAER